MHEERMLRRPAWRGVARSEQPAMAAVANFSYSPGISHTLTCRAFLMRRRVALGVHCFSGSEPSGPTGVKLLPWKRAIHPFYSHHFTLMSTEAKGGGLFM